MIRRIARLTGMLAISVSLAGCGGGSGTGGTGSQISNTDNSSAFQLGTLVGRAAISNPPITSSSNGVSATSVIGNFTSLGAARLNPTLTQTKIAFASNRDGNYEIYSMNSDGSSPTRLTNNSAEDNGPSWSPDATKIAFYSLRDGEYEIYTMFADGSNPVRLTHNTQGNYVPSWSPDGTKIAFTSLRDAGLQQIYVMNADGTGQTRLTTTSTIEAAPSWSPDGSKIYFTSYRNGNAEIYFMNANGSSSTRFTNDAAAQQGQAWAPDGSKLAYNNFATGNWEIGTDTVPASAYTNITNNAGVDIGPSWSPNSARIAFASTRGGAADIWTMTAAGAGLVQLTTGAGSNINPSWSNYITQLPIIGPGSPNPLGAAGIIVTQDGATVDSVVVYDAQTRSSVIVTRQTSQDSTAHNLIFSIDADLLTSLTYTSPPYISSVKVIGVPGALSASGALVSIDATTGLLDLVLPFTGSRAAKTVQRQVQTSNGQQILTGSFSGVFDRTGKNIASHGATEVRIDSHTGKIVSIR